MAKPKKNESMTEDWSLRELGKNYNEEVHYYRDLNKNEAFYAGDQWRNVQSNGLPTPVFNLFKRIINWYISQITSQKTSTAYSPDDAPDEGKQEEMKEFTKALTGHSKDLWEKMKMDDLLTEVLLDGALAGDAYIFKFWDADKKRIVNERIDGVNVYFGNPNLNIIQQQPYILLEFRDMVANLQAEAKKHGGEPDKISGDLDYDYQAGDLAKFELKQQQSMGKTNAVLKIWRDGDKIMARKSTRLAIVRKEWDTKLTRYPLAGFNWDTRKNSYRGRAPGTGLIPNQVFINKLYAMAMLSLQSSAFPRILYDQNKVMGLTNQVGSMVGVNGSTNDVIREVKGTDMSAQVLSFIDNCISTTKDMMGASDAALGDIRPENTSAIIAVTRQAAMPLETIKRRLWSMVEEDALNTLDFIAAFYGKRKVGVIVDGEREIIELDFNKLKKMKMNTKVDVGESSYWSEIASVQTLDNLIERQLITFKQYLKRLPQGFLPNKQELLDEQEPEVSDELQGFVDTLPDSVKQQIAASENPEKFVQDLMQLQERDPEGFAAQLEEMAA